MDTPTISFSESIEYCFLYCLSAIPLGIITEIFDHLSPESLFSFSVRYEALCRKDGMGGFSNTDGLYRGNAFGNAVS